MNRTIRTVVRAATAGGLALLLLTGCRDGPDWRVLQLYGGPGSIEAIEQPDRVQAFRIAPRARSPEPGVAYVGLHRVVGGPYEVPPDVASELAALLVDADTYDWRHTKSEPFLPELGLRFARGSGHVDVAVDPESRMLTVHRHRQRIGVEDFDAAADRLIALLAEAVPAPDAAIDEE